MSTGIEVNFGNKEFKFNVEELTKSNNVINSSKSNLLNNGLDIKNFETDRLKRKLLTITSEESIYNLV